MNFILKKFIFWFSIIHINLVDTKIFFFLALIKSNKQVNTTDLFNKQIVLELRNLNLFNKNVELVSIHTVKYL